jgi:hypothetical protein
MAAVVSCPAQAAKKPQHTKTMPKFLITNIPALIFY